MTNPTPLWRIYCITEAQFTYGYSTSALTTCPNNAGHTIQVGSSTMIKRYNSAGLFSVGNLLTYNTTATTTTLTGDSYYDNLSVPNGIILSTGGYRIFVAGTLTLAGTIQNIGSNGIGLSGGAAAPTGSLGGGAAGGNGNNSGAAGTAGSAVSTSTRLGGNGGSGGNGTGAGGAGGSTSQPTGITGGAVALYNYLNSIAGVTPSQVKLFGGCGGGGGSGTSNLGIGSGGGGGGGLVLVCANKIIVNGGTIRANGGNGGNGAGPNPAGGGGGGGGGVAMVVTSTTLPSTTFVTATGGTGGSAAGGGGTAGANGGNGVAYVYYV